MTSIWIISLDPCHIGLSDIMNFSGPVVPLWKAVRIFRNTDVLEADLDLYDYGEHPHESPRFRLCIYDGDELFYEIETTERTVHFPSQKPCGAIIRDEHPIFNYFPTEHYPDYQ